MRSSELVRHAMVMALPQHKYGAGYTVEAGYSFEDDEVLVRVVLPDGTRYDFYCTIKESDGSPEFDSPLGL